MRGIWLEASFVRFFAFINNNNCKVFIHANLWPYFIFSLCFLPKGILVIFFPLFVFFISVLLCELPPSRLRVPITGTLGVLSSFLLWWYSPSLLKMDLYWLVSRAGMSSAGERISHVLVPPAHKFLQSVLCISSSIGKFLLSLGKSSSTSYRGSFSHLGFWEVNHTLVIQ